MATRSVLDTLDLCTTLGVQTESPSSSQGIGWLSPRISFSTGFVDKTATPVAEVEILESSSCVRDDINNKRSGEDRALDFEFCMATSSLDPVSAGGLMLPADELFHKGRLLPQSLTPGFPRQEKVSVSFSGPLDMHKTPLVNIAMPSQREDITSCVSMSGPLSSRKEVMTGFNFSGPLQRQQDLTYSKFSGPLERQPQSSLYSVPLNLNGMPPCTSSSLPSSHQVPGSRGPKSPAWEKVFGLLRRARSDSHRDRMFSENKEQSLPPAPAPAPAPKVSHPPTKNSSTAALRFIFRRTSSIEKNAKAKSSEPPSQSRSESTSVSTSPPAEPPAPSQSSSSPPHPLLSLPHTSQSAMNDSSLGLSVLHVASPVYPTSSTFQIERDVEEDKWSSSATDVDLKPGSSSNSWRMSETENSLDITFDSPDKSDATDMKKILDRGCSGSGVTPGTINSTRIVMKNLERCSNPPSKGGGKGQEQLRALRTREIRRSPERLASYSSSVRVTPVLNVPACIGPGLRSSKSAKGRLSSLRSLLSFKKDKDEKSLSNPAMAA